MAGQNVASKHLMKKRNAIARPGQARDFVAIAYILHQVTAV